MRRKHFFRPILRETLQLTWKHKGWWILGFFSLFLVSSLSYQFILQGIRSLTNPTELFNSWRQWSLAADPISLFTGQWQRFLSNPVDSLILAAVWVGIGAVLLGLFILSSYSITTILSGLKSYVLRGRFDFVQAFTEAWFHFSETFWALLITYIFSNILVIFFSLPFLLMGISYYDSPTLIAISFVLFTIFIMSAFVISTLATYTLMGIIFDELRLLPALKNGWQTFKSNILISIEMFLLQILASVLVATILVFVVSLIVVPATITGVLLVAAQQTDVASLLTPSTLFLLILAFVIGGAFYSMFYLLSWGLMYMRLDKARPDSRIAAFVEMLFSLQE